MIIFTSQLKNLSRLQNNQFGVQRIIKELREVDRRVSTKQTVADKRKLQSFVETQVKDGKLIQTINRTSKYDDGFTSFLDDFKAKNNMPNILDMTHYSHEKNLLNKPMKIREEELDLLKDFSQKQKRGLFEHIAEDPKKDYKGDHRDGKKVFIPNDEMERVQVQNTRSGIQVGGNFYTVLIDRDTNTQVTTLQRINSFRQLIFMGDCNGVIGYGKGKGADFEQAMLNAMQDCKRNLVPIQIDMFHSCPFTLNAKFNKFKIEIEPRVSGMNSYGHPTIVGLLMLTGINHCSFKVHHRNTTPYAMLNAYMDAVTQNVHAQEISERTGVKVYRQYWGKKLPREVLSSPAWA